VSGSLEDTALQWSLALQGDALDLDELRQALHGEAGPRVIRENQSDGSWRYFLQFSLSSAINDTRQVRLLAEEMLGQMIGAIKLNRHIGRPISIHGAGHITHSNGRRSYFLIADPAKYELRVGRVQLIASGDSANSYEAMVLRFANQDRAVSAVLSYLARSDDWSDI
jgi:hypothetical protein